MSERLNAVTAPGPQRAWLGSRRVARGVIVAVLSLSLIGGPLVVDAARPVAVSLSGMSAVITGSGDGVNVRAMPSFDAEILIEIAEGTSVSLRIAQLDTVLDPDGTTRWWPIAVYGIDGWVTGTYLSDTATTGAGLGSEPTDPVATEIPATTDGTAGDPVVASADSTARTARVADPEGVNIRVQPHVASDVIMLAAAGSVVVLRTDSVDIVTDANNVAWWPVDVNGQLGWVVGSYLSSSADGAAPAPESLATKIPVSDNTTSDVNTSGGSFAPGDRVSVNAGTANGLSIRAGAAPDAAVVGYVRPGDVVDVLSGPDGFAASTAGWYLITNGDVTGHVDGDLLVLVSAASRGEAPVATEPGVSVGTVTPDAPDSSPLVGTSATLGQGDGDDVNIRATVGRSSDIIVTVPDGTSADVLDGPFLDVDGGEWLYVTTESGEGFVSSALVGASSGQAPATVTPTATAPTATATVPVASAEATATAPAESAEPTATATATPTAPAATEPAAPAAGVGSGSFLFPVAGRISQDYGCTSLPFYPIDPNLGCPFHDALDIAAPQGTPIIASDSGTVIFAGWCDCGLGFYVEIDHGNGYTTTYGHMASQPYVATGQTVSQGETIGPVGSTGFSTGPHTHFNVQQNGVTIDPKSVLDSLAFSS